MAKAFHFGYFDSAQCRRSIIRYKDFAYWKCWCILWKLWFDYNYFVFAFHLISGWAQFIWGVLISFWVARHSKYSSIYLILDTKANLLNHTFFFFRLIAFLQITTSAKKLWEKGGVSDMKIPTGGSLAPLQLHGHTEQMWRDSTWSTQGETILAPPRRYPHESNASAGILRWVFPFPKGTAMWGVCETVRDAGKH